MSGPSIFPDVRVFFFEGDFLSMIILGIESSCDETGVAIYDSEKKCLIEEVHSQIQLHESFGGVVPEIASRDHVKRILPLLKTLLKKNDLSLQDIDGIGYTSGPGLIGALLTGAVFARTLAWALKISVVEVHHLEAHLLISLFDAPELAFPFVALIVSGGHTLLVHARTIGDYEILGETLDDAVGEAFDKSAKVLGLGYPGGAALAKLAERGEGSYLNFPKPMIDRPGLDFSFSGIKTHVANAWNRSEQTDKAKADIAEAFQSAVVETLVIKCKRALSLTGLNHLVVVGGVSANQLLRRRLAEIAEKLNVSVFFPRPQYCTDNGAMVAYAAYQKFLLHQETSSLAVQVKPRWPMAEL